MKLTGLAQKVFIDRYSLKDLAGAPMEKTPEEMWRRVAGGIAKQEKKGQQAKWEEKFYDVLKDFKFVPGGRILSGAGTDYKVTYFNCFVIPSPKDSRQGILESLNQLVEIQARSGGVGLNLSSLRPRGARVKTVNGFSSGPVTWAGLFSYATHDVVQQGGSRRGATMLMLWDWHPDIEEFITVKQDLTKIHGANLSVCISDRLMEAAKKDEDWDLVFPDIDDPRYDEKWNGEIEEWKAMGGKVRVYKTVKARFIWDLICKAAWQSAEPGLHFLDRSNKRSNTWYFERLLATNPCGEQPLGGWAVCNLGAMNLAAYVKKEQFDYESFGKDVQVAMRFLDNVIDDTFYFFDQNEKAAKDIRRTGLGIMGIADALIKMKVRYGSDDSLPIVNKMFQVLRDNAYAASVEIAKEKGAFPKFNKEKYLQGFHIQRLPDDIRKGIEKYGIRNAVLLTVAPTGTTSVLASVSSGIEPVYEFEYRQTWRGGQDIVYHPLFKEWKERNPDEDRPDYFVSANDLSPTDHVRIQAVAQDYIDSSISKTVNAPNAHTVEDVKQLYMMAYDMGLKGITYMRDGSRQGVLERLEEPKEQKAEVVVTQPKHKIIPRPMVAHGSTYRIETPVGIAYITINEDEDGVPLEVFINGVGKAGSDLFAMAEGLGKMISMNLRMASYLTSEEKIQHIVDDLLNIGGASIRGFGKNQIRSLPDAVAKVLSMKYGLNGFVKTQKKPEEAMIASQASSINGNGAAHGTNGNGVAKLDLENMSLQQAPTVMSAKLDICAECGVAALVYEEGCKKCYSCGASAC
ncbi:adenosylcobalamin-dependent ribonucleoside-diphosphate reductase [Candidatus Woesebacteria bacterium]|nr:adenosylcobalamin-dependent ribonucleoside-diphosphate reductase [Candidatus Woesebacteria bacterium]